MTKPTKWHVHPAKTQISLGFCPVWSESSLPAWRKLGSLATHCVHSEDWSNWADAQANLSLRWAHSHIVGFVMLQPRRTLSRSILALWSQHCWLVGFHDVCTTCWWSNFNTAITSSETNVQKTLWISPTLKISLFPLTRPYLKERVGQ